MILAPSANSCTELLLSAELLRLLEGETTKSEQRIGEIIPELLRCVDKSGLERHGDLINNACFVLFELTHSRKVIDIGNRIATRAQEFLNLAVERRICNILGVVYSDIADYAASLKSLERAIVIARKLGDSMVEAACLANVVAVLQDMGHYRQAIILAEKVISLADASERGIGIRVQCAAIGLFAAHRIGDTDAAHRFLLIGEKWLSDEVGALRRVFFEKARAQYLVDHGSPKKAKKLVEQTTGLVAKLSTRRTETLLIIALATCQWACGDVVLARTSLRDLYETSKSSRLYHHFVLQALIKVFSNSTSPEDMGEGMRFARELVEFTTSVKKAKFYRQLADRRDERHVQPSAALNLSTIDSLDTMRSWLTSSEIGTPSDEIESGKSRQLTKHEELTAIHDDMARLRVKSIRREIRTDAVDTAENWAIAAEFFDDETGQHCYRVGHLAGMLAREIGSDETFALQVEHAARLHDIGKIAVNEVILLKPGPLDAAEMAAMRLHTEVGAQILSGSDDPTLRMATDIARHHHEWWNGNGYPTRLIGKNIPLSARLCAYADVYDALTHARAYKKAWTHQRALEEIERLHGTQFDPGLMKPFLHVLDRYRADLSADAIPGFADMDSNALIASRKKLMETIAGESH